MMDKMVYQAQQDLKVQQAQQDKMDYQDLQEIEVQLDYKVQLAHLD